MGDTATVTAVAYQRIHERMLAKADEYKGVVLLSVFSHGPGQIYNNKRRIDSLKDLEGLKIRVGGGVVNDVARMLAADRKAIESLLGEALARRTGEMWDAADAKSCGKEC